MIAAVAELIEDCFNTKLVKKGHGNEEKGLPPGNLEIIINIKEHDVFKVSDNHLVIIQNIILYKKYSILFVYEKKNSINF